MLTPLLALIAPFIVWPIELILPYPHIIEELAKAVLVFTLLDLPDRLTKIKLTILIGVLFAFSESVLYLFNIQMVGIMRTYFVRLLVTIPLHVITTLIILLPALKNKKLIIVGVLFASLIHYLFNLYI
ncbi:PrsW family intramembrane metalloprotease [Patescibacteria group bacterium]|nr:PrsW family intramembrane metalloprotease [Patescibacteria group bacterium]MBU0777317.1 PrsW family intramembrane metalloprotease [Patescibacteria group bacterium]MBU0846103.1 PrsW family intramembrane metalloprotease [Patescibacteria group bacterium]MBU0923156.1 PrsW family intramembrane metalloprotease [Patescibacteria group bacterium]MBU1066871.1 PrsW family intramembrane metalloprotease [Patescibacteria group bacterium]